MTNDSAALLVIIELRQRVAELEQQLAQQQQPADSPVGAMDV